MTPKQRFLSSLAFEQPDDTVSFMELEFQLYKEFAGREPVVGHRYQALSAKEKERALEDNAALFIEVAERCGHDAIKGIGGYWELWPGQPAYLWLPKEQDQLAQIRAIRRAAGDKFAVVGSLCAMMCMPDGANLESFAYSLVDDPEGVHAENEAILLHAIDFQQRLLDAGADAILSASDIAYKNGPFLSPKMMDEFFFPYLNRWANSVSRLGVPSIWHTDGNILPVFDRVLESGLSALQCVDPLAGMDIVALKARAFGRLALIGNLDSGLLELGPIDEIQRETKRIIEGCKAGGGFVLSGCNAIYRGIPKAHYEAFCEARWAFGQW